MKQILRYGSVRVNTDLKAVALVTEDDAAGGNLFHPQPWGETLPFLKDLIIDSRDPGSWLGAISVARHLKPRQAALDRGRELVQADHPSRGYCPVFSMRS